MDITEGEGHGDVPKYVEKGVALCDLLVSLAGQKWIILHHLSSFLVKTCFDTASNMQDFRCIMTLLNGPVT